MNFMLSPRFLRVLRVSAMRTPLTRSQHHMPKLPLLLATATLAFAQQYTITTIAGGAPPATPATAASTSIGVPRRVAVDTAGNVYFSASHSVFRLASNGTLTLVAGNGRAGFGGDGGPAIRAQLNVPQGIALDAAGNIYIADSQNNRVRIVGKDGVIRTFAGTGATSFGGGPRSFQDEGPAIQGLLNIPSGVAVDKSGNVFIADTGDNIIRKVTTDGNIHTFAGDSYPGFFDKEAGTATDSEFNKPSDVAFDSAGSLYVADSNNNVVRKITAEGKTISTFAGTSAAGFTGDDDDATKASMVAPVAIAFDGSGNLFILQNGDGRIRKVDTKGKITTVAGNGIAGFADTSDPTKAQFNSPTGLAVDSAGAIYVADALNLRIRKIAGNTVSSIAGNGVLSYSGDNGAATAAQLSGPRGVAVDPAGNLYIADTVNNAVRKVTKAGTITTLAGNGQPGNGTNQLNAPQAVAADAAGNVYVADTGNSRVLKISAAGAASTLAGNDQLYTPTGIAVDSAGNVYVADLSLNVVRKISAAGAVSTVSAGALNGPRAVAVDAAGNVYIADAGNNRIQRVTAAGAVSTVAGNGFSGFSGDVGLAVSAQIGGIVGLASDPNGNLYITDGTRIRRVTAAGFISTIAGTTASGYSGDNGVAATAQLNGPSSIAVDSTGALYVADTGNNAVRLLQPLAGGLAISSLTSGASLQPGVVAPGEVVVIWGSGLGPAQLTQFRLNPAGRVPTTVGGTQVFFNGVAAPILYSSANQVAAIAPFSLAGTKADIVVTYQGQVSTAISTTVVDVAPALFTLSGGGSGAAVAVNQDGTINDAAHPARANTYVTLYATGLGKTNPPGQDGAPSTVPLPLPLQTPTVTIGGKSAGVQFAGGAPGIVAGVMQINALVPTGLTAGPNEVVIKSGNSSSPNGVTIYVSQ
jgi:uncharacterized protein (TIGR03437 family)